MLEAEVRAHSTRLTLWNGSSALEGFDRRRRRDGCLRSQGGSGAGAIVDASYGGASGSRRRVPSVGSRPRQQAACGCPGRWRPALPSSDVVNRELVIGIVAKQSLRPAEPEKSFVANPIVSSVTLSRAKRSSAAAPTGGCL
jgi:hypothetical protein